MLATAETIRTIAEVLSQTKIPCVVDPVRPFFNSQLISGHGFDVRVNTVT